MSYVLAGRRFVFLYPTTFERCIENQQCPQAVLDNMVEFTLPNTRSGHSPETSIIKAPRLWSREAWKLWKMLCDAVMLLTAVSRSNEMQLCESRGI
jgi:hypothetical protein